MDNKKDNSFKNFGLNISKLQKAYPYKDALIDSLLIGIERMNMYRQNTIINIDDESFLKALMDFHIKSVLFFNEKDKREKMCNYLEYIVSEIESDDNETDEI